MTPQEKCRAIESMICDTVNQIKEEFPDEFLALIRAIAGPAPVVQAQSKEPVLSEIIMYKDHGKKIEAVKMYRERTNASLKDAKDAIESTGYKLGFGKASILEY